MKIKRLLLLTLTVLFLGNMLFGCQLAVETASGDAEFIGVYVTRPLQESDYERQKLTPSGAPSRAIYATAKPVTIDGVETSTYEFEGIEGIALFYALHIIDDEKYYGPIIGLEVVDHDVFVSPRGVGEPLKEVNISGTVYLPVSVDLGNLYLAYNPVYQTAGGEVYMLPTDSNFGGGGSVEIKKTTTSTYNAQIINSSTNVKLIIDTINIPEKTVFKQMNDQDKIIETTVALPQEAPDLIMLNEDTVYIIVEEHGYNAENQIEITRTFLDSDAEYFTCKYIGKNGFALGEIIRFQR